MNHRDYKLFRKDEFYHIYNRGNNREPIFIDDVDYLNFLYRLKLLLNLKYPQHLKQRVRITPFPKNCFSIICYCLMPNHFHFAIRQNDAIPIGDFVQKLGTSYAKYFNKRHQKIGNLFQDTFKAKLIDSDDYLIYLTAYIHNNPDEPATYPYSSYREYLGLESDKICDSSVILKYFGNDHNAYRLFVDNYSYKTHQKIQHLTFDE